MANYFDQFDAANDKPSGGNFFDQFDEVSERKDVGGGLVAAAKQAVGATIKGAGQAAADFIPGVSDDNAVKRYGQEVIDANPTAIHELQDIADRPGKAIAEATGNAGGSMAGMLGVRAIGQGITAAAPLAGPAAPAVALAGQVVSWLGPAAVAALPSFGSIRDKQMLNDPEAESSAKDKAVAALGAATVGVIESKFGPQEWALSAMTKEGRAALAEKFVASTLTGSIAKGAAKGAAIEGAEELVQNPVEQLASGDDPTTAESLKETAFGGAMGAIGGGVFGGSAGAAFRQQAKPESVLDAPDVDTAIDTAEKALALPLYAGEPLVTMPDGSTMTRAEAEQWRLDGMVQPSGVPADPIDQARVSRIESERERLRIMQESALARLAQRDQANAALDGEREFSDLLGAEQSDLAYRRRDAAANQARDADFARAQTQVIDEQLAAAPAVAEAQGFDSAEPTAMQLAIERARHRQQPEAPAGSPAPVQESQDARQVQEAAQAAETVAPTKITLSTSRRGSQIITGSADAIKAAEPAIRAALPGVAIVGQNQNGNYTLVVSRSADRAAIQSAVDAINQGTANEPADRGTDATVAAPRSAGQGVDLPGSGPDAQTLPTGSGAGMGQTAVEPVPSGKATEPVRDAVGPAPVGEFEPRPDGAIRVRGYTADEMRAAAKKLGVKALVGQNGATVFANGTNIEKLKAAVSAGAEVARPKRRQMRLTGSLANDLNVLGYGGLREELAKGGDGSGRFDLSLLAERLRNEAGYVFPDVNDDPAQGVTEFNLQDIANGGGTVNAERQVAAKDAEQQAKRRDEIYRQADELGIRRVARKFSAVEQEVLRAMEMKQNRDEAALEDDERAVYDGLLEDAYASLGDDTTTEELERLAIQYADAKAIDYQRAAVARFKELLNEAQSGNESQAERPAEGQAGETDRAGGEPAGARGNEAPGFQLTGQTEAEVRAEQERLAEADAQRARADQDAERKRQADAERDTFSLTGSDRPADVLAAQGQGGLFDGGAPAAAVSPTNAVTRSQGVPQSGMQERPAVRADESGSLEEPAQSGGGAGSGSNVASIRRAVQAYREAQPLDRYEYDRRLKEIQEEIERDWSNGNADDYSGRFGPDQIHAQLKRENAAAYYDADGDLTDAGGSRYNQLESEISAQIARDELGEPQRKAVDLSRPGDMAKFLHGYLDERGFEPNAIGGSGKSASQYFEVDVGDRRIGLRISDHKLPTEYGASEIELALYDVSDNDVRRDGREASVGISEDEAIKRAADLFSELERMKTDNPATIASKTVAEMSPADLLRAAADKMDAEKPQAVQEQPGPAGGAFDSEAFDRAREATIKKSKRSGAMHLDDVSPSVEAMRNREIFYAHNPKQRGVIRTVDNYGNVYVYWSDKYSADKELASAVEEQNKAWLKGAKKLPVLLEKRGDRMFAYQSSLGRADLKDYVFADSMKKQETAGRTAATESIQNAGIAEQEKTVYRVTEPDGITGDLFKGAENALPDDTRENLSRKRKADGTGVATQARALSVRQSQDTPGVYQVSTQIVEVGERKLPVSRVNTIDEAAQAFAYLSKYAVEHYDALVTDKNGKPLAIIGSFKGATAKAAIYPGTVMGELSRIKGAAHLWTAHNHPSGIAELSGADNALSAMFEKMLRGTNVQYHSFLAMAGRGDGKVDYVGTDDERGTVDATTPATHTVRIVEREIVNIDPYREALSSPAAAKDYVSRVARDQPGIVFLDAQNKVAAFVPFDPEHMGKLRPEDRLMRLFGAASKSGASAAIVAMPDGKVSLEQFGNLKAALTAIDVKVLDGIEYASDGSGAKVSLAETRRDDAPGSFESRAVAPAFPDAIIANPLYTTKDTNNTYAYAKAGSVNHAMRLAKNLVTPGLVKKLQDVVAENPLVVGVVSIEETGKNALPQAGAEVLAHKLGLETSSEIVQATAPHRTHMSGLARVFNRPEFDGQVEPGRGYVLVDDTITQGGTVAAMANHIEAGGGHVVSIVALTGKQYSAKLSASDETIQQVREKFGDIEDDFRQATGYGFDGLTESEARHLAKFNSPAAVRDRILAEAREAAKRENESDAQGLDSRQEAPERGLSVSEDQRTEAYKAVKAAIESFKQELPGAAALDFHVASTAFDIPAKYRPSPFADGVYHSDAGLVYLITTNLRNDRGELDLNRVNKVLLHESVGHYGLMAMMGDDFKPILGDVFRLARAKGDVSKGKAGDADYATVEAVKRDYPEASDDVIAMEVLARMAETGTGNKSLLQVTLARIRQWLRKVAKQLGLDIDFTMNDARDLVMLASEYLRRGDNLESTPAGEMALASQAAEARGESANILESRAAIIGDSGRTYTPEQRRAFEATGRTVQKLTPKERVSAMMQDAGKKMAQGIVDQFAPVKDIDQKAYTLLRLSKGATGAFEALMHHGKLSLRDGAYDADTTGGVLEKVFYPLGKESSDFLYWIAGNRAEKLAAEGRENLFTPKDIAAYKSLDKGVADFDYTLANGKTTRDRTLIYRDALKKFNEFSKNVLDMAEQSGLIDGDSRSIWESEFYVPFYRVADDQDGGVRGMNVKQGVVRQEAFKKLKGGTEGLNDLLSNTLMNWAHLIDASAKNRGAKATLEAAQRMGAARKAIPGEKKTVWFMDNGRKAEYRVEDPYLLTALNGLEYAGLRGPAMDAMSAVKHWLTIGVTASPFYKVRNLIRDSMQAIATSDLNANPLANVAEGFRLTDRERQEYVSALAGGGLIRFGTMLEGNEASRTRQLIKKGAKDATILDSESKVRAFYDKYLEPAISAYNELGNRGEEINRMALYDQLIKKGVDHATANLMARDLMDFSMQGAWTSIRFLTQVVPFMNARLQGLYKLGRSAKQDPQRFAAVLGTVTVASLALLAAYSDDDDWKKREDWDRDTYWWFKFGGMAFRIPKPFEIGAMATLAERSAEYLFDNEMTGKRFRERVTQLLSDQLSMNPVPQLVKPIIDVYANRDSFTGRPIETMGMERVAPEYRFRQGTSMVARGVSTAGNTVTGGNFLSPVQVDHLVRGYFSWLGAFVVGGADMAVRAASNEPTKPAADYWKVATGGMAAGLDSASSRYVSQMYEQAKELEQAYNTWSDLLKQGKRDEAAEYRSDHQDELRRYRSVEGVKRSTSRLNERIRVIERSNMEPEKKREAINRARAEQDRLARRLASA